MRKLLLTTAAFGLAISMGSVPALADGHEEAKPEQLDQTWYRVNLLKFKEGKQRRANQIIEMFQSASKAIGEDGPVIVHMNTGEWHIMVFFKMDHGVESLGYASDPDGGKWDAAFEEIAGGEEEARALWEEFNSLIHERQRHLGHIHDDDDEES